MRRWLWGIALTLATITTGCGEDPAEDAPPADSRTWQVVQQSLPGALLSIWMSDADDVWIAGANPGDGGGPMVINVKQGQAFRLNAGVEGDLWWVFARDAQSVWFVGEAGLILRYDRAADTFTQLPSPTEATLFGAWGAATGPLFAVGGFIAPGDDRPGVVVRIDGDSAQVVADIPASPIPKEAWFKVWGSAANDIWVIGDWGSVMHYDGAAWTLDALADSPRLVTLHGDGDDVVIVGGGQSAAIFERGADRWDAATAPERAPALNGVFVTGGGHAVGCGRSAAVVERQDGAWIRLPTPDAPPGTTPGQIDWHAAWIDGAGDIWVVGGDLLSPETMNQGAVMRYGPAR